MSEPQYSPEPPPLMTVFVTVGVRTSAGAGPGVKHLPPQEAAWLIGQKYAVAGDRPPDGYAGSTEMTRSGIFPQEPLS